MTRDLGAIARQHSHAELVGLADRLKTPGSLMRKLITDAVRIPAASAPQIASNVDDALRYSVQIPAEHYAPVVRQVHRGLKAAGYREVRWKNRWPGKGYRGINSTWREPRSGHRFEVQFHTPESYAAGLATRVPYEEMRLVTTAPARKAELLEQIDQVYRRVPAPEGVIGLAAHEMQALELERPQRIDDPGLGL